MADGDIDRIAVALLRKLRPEVQAEFLASPEFRELPDADPQRLYELDAPPCRKPNADGPDAADLADQPRLNRTQHHGIDAHLVRLPTRDDRKNRGRSLKREGWQPVTACDPRESDRATVAGAHSVPPVPMVRSVTVT